MTEEFKDLIAWWKNSKVLALFSVLIGIIVGGIVGESLIVLIHGGPPLMFRFTVEISNQAIEFMRN